MPILQLNNVTKTYKKGTTQVKALKGMNLIIEKGEFLSIVGPSGSGKTTALNIIGCLDTPSSGIVLFNGTNLSKMKEKQLSRYRKENIGFVFQSYNLIPVLTVKENIELPLVIEKKYGKKEISDLVMKMIEEVGLKEMMNRTPGELSGGQEQRVAIARALIKNPVVMLADEPTANLDSHTAEDIISLMQKMNTEHNTTFVFSTHDPLMMKHARRIVVLHDGKVQKDYQK